MLQKEKRCIKSRGVKTFEQNGDVYIFLILPNYHIFLFSTALQRLQKMFPRSYMFPRRQYKLNWPWSLNAKSPPPPPALNACFFLLEHQWAFEPSVIVASESLSCPQCQKFTYTLQNLQNANYLTKIRGIIQIACYFVFSTDLNNIFNIKDVYILYSPQVKIIVEFIKWPRSKVYICFILCCYLNNPQLFFLLSFWFRDSCSWVPCLSWTVKLPAVIQKKIFRSHKFFSFSALMHCVSFWSISEHFNPFLIVAFESLSCPQCEKMDLKITQSLLERVQIHKNSEKTKNLWDLKDFSEVQQQFNCSEQTRDSWTTITKQNKQKKNLSCGSFR